MRTAEATADTNQDQPSHIADNTTEVDYAQASSDDDWGTWKATRPHDADSPSDDPLQLAAAAPPDEDPLQLAAMQLSEDPLNLAECAGLPMT